MRFLWIGIRKDAGMVRRDPFGLLIPIGIPLVLAVLMNMVFGSNGDSTPHGVLLIADGDRSIASGLLAGAFGREPVSNMVTVRQCSEAEGRAQMDHGKASGLLVIPAGLQQAVLSNAPFRLQLFTNPSERIVPRMIQETLAVILDGASLAEKIAGPQLRSLDVRRPPTEGEVTQTSLGLLRLTQGLNRYLQPPLIGLDAGVVQTGELRGGFNFAALFFPCMIFLSLMMVSSSMASEIWKEREAGTLRRLAATPVSWMWYLAGRVLFVAFVLACIGTAGVVSVHAMAGVPVSSFLAAILWVMFSGVALYLFMLILVMYASGPRTANILANMVIFPLSMLGGCFFPFEAMPPWMARIGQFTPNGWAITQFKAILSGRTDAQGFALACVGLLAVSAAALVLSARRLRRGFAL